MNEHGTTAREKRGALHFINYQSGVLPERRSLNDISSIIAYPIKVKQHSRL
jgi:hypothetical protein